MRLLLSFLLFTLLLNSCGNVTTTEYIADTKIIPEPSQLTLGNGYFKIPRDLMIIEAPESFDSATQLLSKFLGSLGFVDSATVRPDENVSFIFKEDATIENEGYVLEISEEQITISASSSAGAFYGVQTFRQLLPPLLEDSKNLIVDDIKIPVMVIKDAPQFSHRGMHLDVSRHFFPKEFIKEYIANLAMLKMNTFHWHLTDDQGWRIEIKKYPKLTSHAAYRDSTFIGHYNDAPQRYEKKRYGGFYTQEDIKEIVAFAKQHHVTVIPEIEMPGHAQAAVSAYPELGCTGKQVPVAGKWGVFENIFCPNEQTFTFLKDVLTETMELFPSEYIHIGGDEAPKTQWKACGHCQDLIAKHNLKDENGLQSWFIKEIESFVNSKGKKIIGWDEILEGGLAPNATVMSWRGTKGAVEAAKEGHDVILTPTSHSYFDYYQATYEDEPTAIGGYLPLKKVYGFNPIPSELTKEEAKHVLGAQGNIWTEYMQTEDQVEYMAFPRILAMSEVVWSGLTENLDEDYADFLTRVEPFMERLDVLEINYANHLYDLEGAVVKKNNEVFYELSTPTTGKEIKYSINNGDEASYIQPIKISEDATIKANVYKDGEKVGRTLKDTINYHKGINATISLNVEPHPAYGAGGKEALINGVQGSNTRFGDKEWLGFWGDDVEITIVFDKPTKINKISTRFYNANGQWLYVPKKINASGQLKTGVFLDSVIINGEGSIINTEIGFGHIPDCILSSIKLTIPSYGVIPDGLQGAGNKAWTFIDEIIIE